MGKIEDELHRAFFGNLAPRSGKDLGLPGPGQSTVNRTHSNDNLDAKAASLGREILRPVGNFFRGTGDIFSLIIFQRFIADASEFIPQPRTDKDALNVGGEVTLGEIYPRVETASRLQAPSEQVSNRIGEAMSSAFATRELTFSIEGDVRSGEFGIKPHEEKEAQYVVNKARAVVLQSRRTGNPITTHNDPRVTSSIEQELLVIDRKNHEAVAQQTAQAYDLLVDKHTLADLVDRYQNGQMDIVVLRIPQLKNNLLGTLVLGGPYRKAFGASVFGRSQSGQRTLEVVVTKKGPDNQGGVLIRGPQGQNIVIEPQLDWLDIEPLKMWSDSKIGRRIMRGVGILKSSQQTLEAGTIRIQPSVPTGKDIADIPIIARTDFAVTGAKGGASLLDLYIKQAMFIYAQLERLSQLKLPDDIEDLLTRYDSYGRIRRGKLNMSPKVQGILADTLSGYAELLVFNGTYPRINAVRYTTYELLDRFLRQ